MKKAAIQMEAVSCPSCVRKIETVLAKVKGVTSAAVMFNSSKVKVSYDETKVEVKQLEEAIEKLGFLVLSSKSL